MKIKAPQKVEIFGLRGGNDEKLADYIDHTFELDARCRFGIDFGRPWY